MISHDHGNTANFFAYLLSTVKYVGTVRMQNFFGTVR